MLGGLDRESVALARLLDHRQRRRGDLRTDAVAGEDGDAVHRAAALGLAAAHTPDPAGSDTAGRSAATLFSALQ